MSNFNKNDIARAVAPDLGINNATAILAIEKIFATIKAAAEDGNKVAIPGFGHFKMKERAARQGRNPQTGEPVDIPARSALGFRPSKSAA